MHLADPRLWQFAELPVTVIEHRIGVDVIDENIRKIAAPMKDIIDRNARIGFHPGAKRAVAIVGENDLGAWIESLHDSIDLAPAIPEGRGLEVEEIQPLLGVAPHGIETGRHGIPPAELRPGVAAVIECAGTGMERLILEGEQTIDPLDRFHRRQTCLDPLADLLRVTRRVHTDRGRMLSIKPLETTGHVVDLHAQRLGRS